MPKVRIMLLISLLLLLAILTYSQTIIRPTPQPPPTSLPQYIFVRNLTAGGEKPAAVTVVFKRDAPYTIIQQAYQATLMLYTKESILTTAHGHVVKVKEVKMSKLVQDKTGRYLFKVADTPQAVAKALNRYKDYIEAVITKPAPSLLTRPIDPDILKAVTVTPTNAIISDLIGATQAQTVYGVDGTGINIAIIDTGIDYGHPDLSTALRYWSGTYKGDTIREPLLLDADESQVLLLQPIHKLNTTHIYVGGKTYTTLTPWPVEIYPPCDIYRIPERVGNEGQAYRFGLTYAHIPGKGLYVVGVLLIKWTGFDYFSHALVDANSNCDFNDEFLASPPFSQTNEWTRGAFLRYFLNRIIAPDYDSNGFPDVSLGVAGGFFYDFIWWFSYPAEIHPGWDKQGRWMSIFYDYDGHGTAAASAAAGRGVVTYNIPGLGAVRLRGIAPGAGVIGVKALWVDNVEVGMLWAAGFDIAPETGRFYYTGTRRADIISNSWGFSYFAYDLTAFGLDLYSIFVTGLSLPGFLDPRYPGILIVQAGGNGGPGFGTITSPGAAPCVLTVGASTSLHTFTPAGWTSDEVIDFSLRGPTHIGYIKPDVVNVGAFGYTAAPVAENYTLFAGTSYATPLTAGVAALVYQVLGKNADPALVKVILQSTAVFLRYDTASQGFGRVDAYRAVSLARLLANRTAARYELLVYSNSLWREYATKASSTWQWQWCDNIRAHMVWNVGTDLPVPSCDMPPTAASRIDGNLFFGYVLQGGAKTITITIRNPTNKTVSVSLIPQAYTVIRTLTLTRTLSLAPGAHINSTYWVFTASNLTFTWREMEAIATIPYRVFDADNDYLYDVRVTTKIYLWTDDANANGAPDPWELTLVNFGTNYANWNLATMSAPTIKLGKNRGIIIEVELIRGPDAPSYVPPTPVTLTVNYISTMPDTWVSVSPTSAVIPPKGTYTFTLTVRPPINAMSTTYIGELVLANNLTGYPMQIPYSFNVYTTVGHSYVNLTAGNNSRWPEVSKIRGAQAWNWRFESGDWRLFHIKPADTNGLVFEIQTRWTNPDTTLIGFTTGPDGQFAGVYAGQGYTYFAYKYAGIFAWTNTGAGSITNAKRIVWFPAVEYRYELQPHKKPEDGIYTVIVRSALFDASTGATEPITTLARLIPAINKLPPQIIGQQLSVSYLRFPLPYLTRCLQAYALRPSTPLLDFDQKYAPANIYVAPTQACGPYPNNTQVTFTLTIDNLGAPGQKIDVSLIVWAQIPSLPIIYRENNIYTSITNWYPFEDWTRSIK